MNGYSQFITFEGIDGTGKSTQVAMLAERLRAAGFACVATREPGGTAGAERIRELLKNVKDCRWSVDVEVLLLTAARREHIDQKIGPALKSGKIVICDRFLDSTRVYQGLSSERIRAIIETLHEQFIGISPDLTFVLDLSPRAALKRIGGRGNDDHYFEAFGNKIALLRQGFLDLARDHQDRCRVVDASQPATEIADYVYKEIRRRFG